MPRPKGVKAVEKMASEKATLPEIQELLVHIIQELGGLQTYAKMIASDVQEANKGSAQRLTFHNNFLTSIAKFGGTDELDGADLETLERMLSEEKESAT